MTKQVCPDRAQWPALCSRGASDDGQVEQGVRDILEAVRTRGDEALVAFAERFDNVTLPQGLKVTPEEIREAQELVPAALQDAIRQARDNIRRFHEAQRSAPVRVETAPGVVCCQKAVPIRRVGLYVPGGRAPLFSTVLMLAVPARVAGCEDVLLCSPPGPDGRVHPAVVFTASLCGVTDIYKVGGAQAIAAMAYGTASISRRDKIFGPGNRYVTKAKQLLGLSEVSIDMPAGPSEVMVLADATADPAFVAADFLSQAEHGPDSQSVLVCTEERVADAVAEAVAAQVEGLSRRENILRSLSRSRLVVLPDRGAVVDFANEYAPEHLIVAMADPWDIADRITAAGSVFVGPWSPESAGDYASGTNHTLPTGGWARSCSGLGLDAFQRKMTFQELTREGLQGLGGTIRAMALAEGLDAHAAAVTVRLGGADGK
ncbi:MAG: histidinol dehydrogenase [Bacteroidales bacterium]|nr:histidinol dehydrogenase [Bacteroidales bacterium]